MSRFLNEKYKALKEYVPGEQPKDMKYVKLNTNESPFPPSEGVVNAVNRENAELLRLYPDPDCSELCEKLAGLFGFEKENVFVSNGSDDILNFAFMAFCSDGETPVVFPDISYGFYKVYADLHKADYQQIPLKADFSICADDYVGVGKNVVIANPNAPTGLTLSLDEIERIVASNPENIVLIDEAYVDFGARSCIGLVPKYDNLIVVRTFSKSYSLAGARLGFAIASKEIIADLNKIKFSTNPYNINRISLIAGCRAIEENSYYMNNCKLIAKTRRRVTEELRRIGFEVLDSEANFIFARTAEMDGETLYLELKKRGVLVRHFTVERIKDFNRITIGTDDEMNVFLREVKTILGKA
ncbi:MAG: histidinol-phosphate transaminase [Ruminococcaceae bacterium]|nr:histidinol-phosphate transaminase [Oscillospiraceae bacterium]